MSTAQGAALSMSGASVTSSSLGWLGKCRLSFPEKQRYPLILELLHVPWWREIREGLIAESSLSSAAIFLLAVSFFPSWLRLSHGWHSGILPSLWLSLLPHPLQLTGHSPPSCGHSPPPGGMDVWRQ